MHGTLMYPVPGRARLTRPKKFRDNPRIPSFGIVQMAVLGEAGYGS